MMKTRTVRLLVGAAVAAGFVAITVPQSESAGPSCTLTPQMREVAIDQGLPGYPRLVRGKETLLRAFFTLPSCADTTNGANIMVKSATLAVKNGTSTLTPPGGIATAPAPLGPAFPLITTPSSATLPPDAAGNPIFVVPGSVLAPSSTTSFTATFEITLTFAGQANRSSGYSGDTTATFTTLTGSRSAITKPVEKRTNSLRILAVPMGGVLSADATTNLQNAMTTMSRIWPVPDGTVVSGTPGVRTGDLFTGTGGIRYSINAGVVNLTGLLDSTGKFCGNSTNWTSVKSQLAQFLQTWNSANTNAQADRVSGIGDPLTTISNTDSSSCAEGMASVVSSESWFRASADKAGPTAAMEMCHTFGCVPGTRSDGAYHSLYANADFTTGDADRGYNITDRRYLADDKSAMRYSSTWTNANAIFGRDDFAMMLCKLGGATTNDCGTSGVAGTSSGVTAGSTVDSFVMSGTTDGTKTGTKVLESFTAGTLPTPADAASPYRLRQFNGATKVADDGVPVSVEDSVHTDGAHASSPGVFSIAFPVASQVTKIVFVNAQTGEVLYQVNANAPPQIGPQLTLLKARPHAISSPATIRARRSVHTDARHRVLRSARHATAPAFPTRFRPLAGPGSTYTVNTNADTDDGTCDAVDCTLRESINASNSSPGMTDTVAFDLPAGSLTITPASALPAITDQVLIDGNTQPGWVGPPVVEINGSGTPLGTFGFFLNTGSGNSTIRGLAIDSFPGEGIHVKSNVNHIAGNYIGTDVSGAIAKPNTNGIAIETGTSNVIGGPAISDRNVISGNSGDAIYLSPGLRGNADSNTIQGNYLGTTADGNAALQNGGRGVTAYSSHNSIVGNVIAANSPNIWILGDGSAGTGSDNTIQANLIGTDAVGTASLGRSGGIALTTGASNNLIGGTSASDRNVIAGTGGPGIMINDAGTTGNVVQGNYIGPDKNGGSGLATSNGQGVYITGASGNTIGGTAAGAGNVIAYNQSANGGVIVSSGTQNAIFGNSIFSNSGLGIDLAPSNAFGVTTNDAGDGDSGPNNLQNYPVLSSVATGGSGTTVQGTLNSEAGKTYRLEFFANGACDDVSGHGEGKTVLGSTSVVTNASGDAGFTFNSATPINATDQVTATATDPTNNTSEFSACKQPEGTGASADLAVTKADSPDPVGLGNQITYTITVRNDGPDAASAVEVSDTLPASVTFVSASPTQGTCSGTTTVTCSLGDLANGATATVTIVVTTTAAGSIMNQATIASSTNDPNAENNSASESTEVEPAGGGGGGSGTGTNLRQITADLTGTACADKNGTADGPIGVGVAFDGTNLLASCYTDSTITVVNPANGAQVSHYPVSGATNLGALAWDKSRNVIWACSEFSKVGQIDPTTHVFTSQFTVPGCFDGLAYDIADDTIWTSPDATSSITHSGVDGTVLSTNTVSLGSFGNSGIAVGGPNLYLANNGGQEIYTSPKDFSTAPALFASFPSRLEDLECDNVTFASQSKDAIWSADAYDKTLNAWQIPAGTCSFGGGEQGGSTSYTATDTDSDCADLRSDVFLKQPDGTLHVLAVGLQPTTCGSSATFDFDAAVGCAGCKIEAKVYDGFKASPLTEIADSSGTADPLPTDPVVAINSTAPGADILQYDPVTLDGSGWDAQDGVLAGDKLSWSAPCLFSGTKTLTSVYLSPPANGWTPNSSCTVTLNATDAQDNAATPVTRTFHILADADHDKIPAAQDVKCEGGSTADDDPLSDRADYDGDGIPNGTDSQQCSKATLYDDGFGVFLSTDGIGKLKTSNGDPVVSASGVRVFYVPGLQFVPLSGVRISKIDGEPVSGLQAVKGGGSGEIGVWGFNRRALLDALVPLGVNRAHVLTLRGDTTTPRQWSFEINIDVFLSSG